MADPSLYPCFLGPYGENDTLLEKLIVEFLRDHVYWRRNFHPEDPPAIPTRAAMQPSFPEFEARLRREQPLQLREFFGSTTTVRPQILGEQMTDDLFRRLGLVENEIEEIEEESRLLVLRHTLMNPFLLDEENGISYIDRYFDFLTRRVAALCTGAPV